MREKLIELFYAADRECNNKQCVTCKHQGKRFFCKIHFYIDHLIAHGVTVQQWISVKERLPDENTRVLVWLLDGANKYTRMDTDRRYNGKWVRWEKYVTHWMPLPQAPKG